MFFTFVQIVSRKKLDFGQGVLYDYRKIMNTKGGQVIMKIAIGCDPNAHYSN